MHARATTRTGGAAIAGRFLSDGATGATLATFTTPGKYSVKLVAIDGAKNSADVLAWSFAVKERVDEVFGKRGDVS